LIQPAELALHIVSNQAKLWKLYQVKSSQALQVVSSQANLYWLFQVEPSSAVWFNSSEALQVLKQPADLA
jgi:hypothetical protein